VTHKLLAIAFLLIGILLGILSCTLPSIKWDPTVNVISLASLIMMVIVAILIPVSIEKYTFKRRHELATLHAHAVDLVKPLERIQELLERSYEVSPINDEQCREIVRCFRKLNNGLYKFERLLAGSEHQGFRECIEDVKRRVHDYKGLITAERFPISEFRATEAQLQAATSLYRRIGVELARLLLRLVV